MTAGTYTVPYIHICIQILIVILWCGWQYNHVICPSVCLLLSNVLVIYHCFVILKRIFIEYMI